MKDAEDPRWNTAVHEAGHAVVSRAVGRALDKVTIEPDDEAFGRCTGVPFPSDFHPDLAGYDDEIRQRVEAVIIASCAGGIAQSRVDADADRVLRGAEYDENNAQTMAQYASGGNDDEASVYVTRLRERARSLVFDPEWWSAIEALATELLSHPTLTGDQVEAVIQSIVEGQDTPRGRGRL